MQKNRNKRKSIEKGKKMIHAKGERQSGEKCLELQRNQK